MKNLFIGLMSGTSADGIDAVLVDLSDTPKLIQHEYTPYDPLLRHEILAIMQPSDNEIERLGQLDRQLGILFAKTVETLLRKANCTADQICAIGSHGQTIRHYPYKEHPFTLQIADPNLIAAITGITTIADFRRKDMALGGQGAPLVPRFHQAIFQTTHTRFIINIGGIANVTILSKEPANVMGFDTGPGNALLDAWCQLHTNKTHDEKGSWAKVGTVHQTLLASLLKDAYFQLKPPKSTGRDYFHLAWLQHYLDKIAESITPEDVQATLVELTACTILDAIQKTGISHGEMVLCGGGVHNHYLLERIQALSPKTLAMTTSDKLGVHPNLVEAIAFAWLAKQTLLQQPGNLPSVTGATNEAILGGIYY